MLSTKRIALLAGVAVVSIAAQPAAAKSGPADLAPAAAQVPAAQTDDPATPDIIVTATKRAERLQDVPASVSVVTAGDLTKQGAVRFADYASQVPGLSLASSRTGNTQVTLRGITTGASQPGSTTAFYVDEAPVGSVNAYTGGNGITPDLDPSDIAQVEVLKGPQGTLYGAGAVGGLLKFSTTSPNLSQFEGSASAGVNDVAHGGVGYSARGMVNVPLATDQLALHVSGFYRRDAGYIDNINPIAAKTDTNDAKVRGGRGVLSMKFDPHLRLDLSAILQDTTTDGSNIEDVDAATLKPLYGEYKQSRFARETGRERLRLYNATLHADLGRVSLVSSTTYQRIYYQEIADGTLTYGGVFAGLAGIPDLGVAINTVKHTERWSEEARASVNDLGGVLDLQAGFYWTHESDENRIPGARTFHTTTGADIPTLTVPLYALLGIPTTSPYGLVQAKIDSTYQEYSGFGNARLHFGDTFDILAGIRYSHDDQSYTQDYEGLLIPAITAPYYYPSLKALGGETHNVATWLVSPSFHISHDAMLYARAASGYRPGGPNPAPPTGGVPLTFQPDRLVQYEVGFKGSTPNNLLSIDAALFYTDWKNIQIQTSSGGFNYLVNGGTARSEGGELTLGLKPTTGLTFGLNAAYTDAKLTSDAPLAKGSKGDSLPYVPRWSGSLTADYATTLSGDTKLTLGGSLNYTGKRTSDYSGVTTGAVFVPNYPKHLNAYTTVDLRAGLDFGKWSLSAFARNLTDNRAIVVVGTESLANNATPGAAYGAAILQPRTIGLEAAVRF